MLSAVSGINWKKHVNLIQGDLFRWFFNSGKIILSLTVEVVVKAIRSG